MTTLRAQLAAALRPMLPGSWTVVDHQKVPDGPREPFLVLAQNSFRTLPEAPAGALLVDFTLTLGVPGERVSAAEDKLDDAVAELLSAIQRLTNIQFTSATKVVVADKYFGWDIAISVGTIRKEGAPE